MFYIFILLEEKMLKHSCLISRDTLTTQKQITQAKTMSLHSLQRVDNRLQCLFLDISNQIQVLLSFAYCRPVNVIFAVPRCATGPSLSWELQSQGWPGLALARAGLGWFQLCLGAKCLCLHCLSLRCASASMGRVWKQSFLAAV